jgi:hypothetical protein
MEFSHRSFRRDQRILRQPRPPADPPAPDIVESILDGQQLAALTLAVLMKPFPVEWERQWRTFTTAKPNALGRNSRARHMALNKN